MQIDRIILRDVGPFKDVTIELPRGKDPKLADVYLLTGPNGSGKSTVLYALGALIAGGEQELGQSLLARRFASPASLAGLAAGETRRVVVRSHMESFVLDPFGGPPLEHILDSEGLAHHGNTDDDNDYAVLSARFKETRRPFEWAAFAYTGRRTLERGAVGELRGPTPSPFDGSLSFTEPTRTQALADWIANQRFKRLNAQVSGDTQRAIHLESGIRATEQLIGQIIDDNDFQFVISTDEDIEVRARWNGAVIDLDLLPDGLKSIASWVADLLMRLDRIPWVGNVPVLERQFLLLLDEVDIHLHPAWQRKVLPFVQRMFPNAQIIATTHSPFVVGSVADAHIVTFALRDGVSTVEHVAESQIGVSYSAVLREIFGITSEFDVDTERELDAFHQARKRLLSGDGTARDEVDRVAADLARRSEEVAQVVALELAQLKRQLARRQP